MNKKTAISIMRMLIAAFFYPRLEVSDSCAKSLCSHLLHSIDQRMGGDVPPPILQVGGAQKRSVTICVRVRG